MSLPLRPEVQVLVHIRPVFKELLITSSLALATVDVLGFIKPSPRLS
jgi:hypothetical protein